ncbi:MAG: DUF4430 domain-containing protein [Thermoplasmatales archaeon]|nr:MAG: DUF4430 domain-containing protein [Thermoplasmatales archaeon]
MKIEKWSNMNQIVLMIGLIIIGTLGRYLLAGLGMQPFPNFEIIMVLTFLAVMFLKPTIAIFVPLLSMIFSDLLIGNSVSIGSQMNRIVLFTYSGFTMIALINVFNRDRLRRGLAEIRLKNVGIAAGLGIGFVLVYDVWTNLGWWYLIYPHNVNSLAVVFTAGVPFMIYHMISGIVTFVVIALPVVAYVSKKTSIELPIKIKNIHKIPVVALALCLTALSFTGTATQVPEKSEVWLEKSDETSVKIMVLGDGWTLEDNLIAYDGDTVFSILDRSLSRNSITFKYTYYEQFDSMLIDSIGEDLNGEDGKYWQYYVNNDIPMIGCDKYTVSNGDYIEWRFETIPV